MSALFSYFPSQPLSLSPPLTRRTAVTTTTSVSVTAISAIGKRPTEILRAPSSSTPYDDYQSLFVSQRSETTDPIELKVVEGDIPPDFPFGTYYLVGPGIFTDDYGSSVNPLDGHGYLRAFRFLDGVVKYSARYVTTEAQREERDENTGKWRFVSRGGFSVLRGGQKLGNTKVMKNVANTCVVLWSGRLLCLWDGGDPYEIEPESLSTVGRLDVFELAASQGGCYDDVGLRENWFGNSWIYNMGMDVAAMLLKSTTHGLFRTPNKRLLSHYKIDSKRKRLIVLACNIEDMVLPAANFTFYEFDEGLKLVHMKQFRIPDQMLIHDWCFTDNHYIIVGNRVKIDIPGLLTAALGLSPMLTALTTNPSQETTTPVYLLPRFTGDGGKRPRDWRKPIEVSSQHWVLHIGNGFEVRDEDGNMEVQFLATACSYEWFNFHRIFGYDWRGDKLDPDYLNGTDEVDKSTLLHLIKVSIILDQRGNHKESFVSKPYSQWKRPSEFPTINQNFSGQKNNYVYASTTNGNRQTWPVFPFDSLVKVNTIDGSVATWYAGDRRFIGESVFVPTGDREDDGYILVVEYAVCEKKCYLDILDARNLDSLVAKIEIPKHLTFPFGVHGFWAENNDAHLI